MEGYKTLLRLNLTNEIQKEAYEFIMNRPNKKESISSYIAAVIVAHARSLDGLNTVKHEQVLMETCVDLKTIEDLIRKTITEVLQENKVEREKEDTTTETESLEILPEETITDIAAMLGL